MREKLILTAKKLNEKSKTARYAFSVLLGVSLIIILIIVRVNLGHQIHSFEEVLLSFIEDARSSITLLEDSIPDFETTFSGVKQTLDDFHASSDKLPQLLDNLGNFFGNDFASIAVDGEKSLKTAAAGARIVDETLSFLSQIPLLNIKYNPKQTLEQGLQQLADNFSAIKPGLEQVEQDVETATQDIKSFSLALVEIKSSISNLIERINGLTSLAENLRTKLDLLETNIRESAARTQRNLTVTFVILILLILMWLFNISLNYFANLTPDSGKILIEQDRSDLKDLSDNIVSNNSNQRRD